MNKSSAQKIVRLDLNESNDRGVTGQTPSNGANEHGTKGHIIKLLGNKGGHTDENSLNVQSLNGNGLNGHPNPRNLALLEHGLRALRTQTGDGGIDHESTLRKKSVVLKVNHAVAC